MFLLVVPDKISGIMCASANLEPVTYAKQFSSFDIILGALSERFWEFWGNTHNQGQNVLAN